MKNSQHPICRFQKIPQDLAVLQAYGAALTGVTDDFWEDHLLNAQLYEIQLDQKAAGHFALFDSQRITLFSLQEPFRHLAQPVFRQILAEEKVASAFVPTCDELFLALCLDVQQKVEIQAYFFDGAVPHPVRPAEYPRALLSEIAPSEIETVNKETDGFFDFATEASLKKGAQRIFRLAEDGEILGYGVLVPTQVRPGFGACGMITLPPHRRKGVGRSIQLHLADICREMGLIPISGCWAGNHLSKATIQSAGRYSKTRLLNILF